MINPIRILIGVMLISLFNLITAFAEITIDGDTLHVETAAYAVQFDRGVITQLHNKLIGETYTLPFDTNRNPGFRAETGILGRHHSVWARHARTVETRRIDSDNAEIVFRRDGNEIRITYRYWTPTPTNCLLVERAYPIAPASTGCSGVLKT